MRSLEGSKRARNGVLGVVIAILVVAVGQSFSSVPILFAQPTYYAEFADSAGMNPGDKVRIAGVDVGRVQSLEIDGDHVLIGFTVGQRTIGTQSRLAIRTETILGRRLLSVQPHGDEVLATGGVVPVSQTTTPYQLYDAVADATSIAQGWNIQSVKQSLKVLSETIDQTYPNLSDALDGIARFSDTIGQRDEQFKQLLANANSIAKVLGQRSGQVNQLLVHAQTLIAAVNDRGRAIDYLLSNISLFSQQFTGFINDNPNLNAVLQQLRTVSEVLVNRKQELADILTTAAKFVGALAESLASGPYFKTLVVNLLPYQILQPWVDAAFKKRGIDPEEFWRNAGLPAFRFPDPNGQRQPNGAPPPAPEVLEGTPEFPGPAVPPGSPCSYTPPADGIPTPNNPLPCAELTEGPFGPTSGSYGLPGVVTSAPNPEAVGGPGVPSAAIPGQLSPNVAGVPTQPLAPGPPGARTVPVAPVPGPAGDVPGYAPPPPALIGPIPPPGPGPSVPPVGALAPLDVPDGNGGA